MVQYLEVDWTVCIHYLYCYDKAFNVAIVKYQWTTFIDIPVEIQVNRVISSLVALDRTTRCK